MQRNGYAVRYWDKKTSELLHTFFVNPKSDRFMDHTCNSNCMFKYMLAMDMEWIDCSRSTMPVTCWEELGLGRVRIELKGDDVVLRYKDQYSSPVLNDVTIKQLEIYIEVYKGIKKMMNLPQYQKNPGKLKPIARDLFKTAMRRRHGKSFDLESVARGYNFCKTAMPRRDEETDSKGGQKL